MADDDFWMQVEQEEMQQWYAQTKQEFKDKFNEIFGANDGEHGNMEQGK